MSNGTEETIYSMLRVSKSYGNRIVIRDISLSYFYGAKIGVVGLNGAGKSSLLRIMAGVDRDYDGEAVLSPGFTVGFLEQEPQLDLDVNTMRALEEALEHFGGCAVVISHDSWFLDRIATHILAFEGDSTIVWFEGNYSAYEADRKRRHGKAADEPHRIKYRHLTRG